MIDIIKSQDRHTADFGWLQTHWHFSFGEYNDPGNVQWSALRVFNDDVVQGGGGFGMHPHRDMEIVTYVLDGELAHEDSVGNRGVVRPGEVQVMSAGKGIFHAERNASKEKPVHLLQLWILPRERGGKPRWAQRQFSRDERAGRLLPVVSGGDVGGALTIDQDATIYVSSLRAGESVTHAVQNGHRHAYLFVTQGEVIVNGRALSVGDQARIADEVTLDIAATTDAELMLLDLP
ncbi:MAG: quercetin 2,3-dioxygenase [Phycisphaerales bacterium]|jgi:redox-sensitive bicupin YhaK (pirin superfamily)|nr:quercetin 2,3-dioxygenase [Phycisphaerales bacterium]